MTQSFSKPGKTKCVINLLDASQLRFASIDEMNFSLDMALCSLCEDFINNLKVQNTSEILTLLKMKENLGRSPDTSFFFPHTLWHSFAINYQIKCIINYKVWERNICFNDCQIYGIRIEGKCSQLTNREISNAWKSANQKGARHKTNKQADLYWIKDCQPNTYPINKLTKLTQCK